MERGGVTDLEAGYFYGVTCEQNVTFDIYERIGVMAVPVVSINLTPTEARALAAVLLKEADAAEKMAAP